MRILIIEDEKNLAESLKFTMETFGYAVDFVTDGEEGERRILINHKEYDLVILDWMLPHKDGLQICKSVRSQNISIPILILTARFDLKDKVAALNAGADDYLVKPFSIEELEARVRALLRRPAQAINKVLEVGTLKLDITTHKVTINDKIVRLTPKEFSLLEYLMRQSGKVVPREQLMDHLWGFDFNSFSNVIDVHMKNLRRKLKFKTRSFIETVRGIGYRIKNQS
jgi:DNA-binding response OmpR family regulator